MIVMFSARRLKPGAWDHHARNIRDETRSSRFGLFDMTEDDYRRWRSEADAEENHRVDPLAAFVTNEYVSGVYEVVDTVER